MVLTPEEKHRNKLLSSKESHRRGRERIRRERAAAAAAFAFTAALADPSNPTFTLPATTTRPRSTATAGPSTGTPTASASSTPATVRRSGRSTAAAGPSTGTPTASAGSSTPATVRRSGRSTASAGPFTGTPTASAGPSTSIPTKTTRRTDHLEQLIVSRLHSESSKIMKVTKKSGPGGTDGGIKHVCDLCTLDITNTVFIRCAEDICKGYELCINCFCNPKLDKDHNPATHSYRVIDPNNFPIFTADWGADEELRLIEGAEKYGIGSWADIASHIGGFRTKEECEQHYYNTYVDSPNFPLPERADINDMELTESITKEEFQTARKARIAAAKEENEKAAAASAGPKQKPTASVPACHEIQGFMPGRLEFETEHANEAEEVVQGMSFEPGDGINPITGELDPEHMLKQDVLSIYNDRLDHRAERKRVIFEHELLNYRKLSTQEKKLPKEEKDIINRCKPFAQLMNKEEYEDFVASQRKIHGLRTAINQVQDWRLKGVTSLEDGNAYETAKLERAARQAHAQQGQFDRLPNAGRPSKPQPAPEQPTLAQMLTAAKLPDKLERALSGSAPIPAKEFVEMVEGLQNVSLLPTDLDNVPPAVDSGYRCQPIKDIIPWNMGPDVPDINHLLAEEISLCNVCNIRPKPYFVIKEGVIREAMRLGGSLKKKDVKAMLPQLDPQKVSRIHDLFIRAGWIGKA